MPSMGSSPRLPRALLAGLIVAIVAFAAFVAHVGLGVGGSGSDWLFNDFVYNGLELMAAAACLVRAWLVREERLPWLILGFGLLCYAAGDISWTLFLSDLETTPFPSIADAFYLAFYPASYVAIVMLVRARVKAFRPSLWLDGAIAALAASAIVAALVLQPILDTATGTTAAVVTTLAYPVGDLLLLGLVVAILGLTGWRPGRGWVLLGVGLALSAVADGIYLLQTVEGTYAEGTLLDALWPASVLLIGFSAWQPARIHREASFDGMRSVAVPVASVFAGLVLMIYDHFERMNLPALVLTAGTLLLACVRMGLSFLENQRMLSASRREALTDALTGLRNRRSLMDDLDREFADLTPHSPRAVVLFDLDGFKLYNDTFGHPAGDALLARLGRRLAEAAEPFGSAYRLGGDEFCALVRPGRVGLAPIIAATTSALSEEGEGFAVTASHGAVSVPAEAGQPTEALQVADRRMYAEKGGRRSSPGRQSRDVLLSTLRERQPDLYAHLTDVTALAIDVGRAMGMTPEEVDVLGRAAELHDVGKIAIPETILDKPGPLDDAEWAFMRRHTIIGERILMAAPALAPVAAIVRSTHERWDGQGYPDALADEEIPLGARIVAVCDAFDAMTTDRPYREGMSAEEALAELRRCAGTQFDPAVVDEFDRAYARVKRRPSTRRRSALGAAIGSG
jgi:two-component system, cell cycle response regulator